MNRKHRNKNRQSKPSNPLPPQKVKTEAATEEKVESIVQKDGNSDQTLEVSERGPEINSEVIATPVSVIENSQVETPKKPKRNKGKKKNQDKEDDIDEEKEQACNLVVENIEVNDEIKVDQHIETQKVDLLEEVNMVPTARKKKNKNKKNLEQPIEEKQQQEENTLKEQNNDVDIKPQTLPSVEAIEKNTRVLKKKNKKKRHRTDSEKSDVAEEVISCTTAFQKLLDAKDESADEESKECKEEETRTLDELSAPENITETQGIEIPNKIEPLQQDIEMSTEIKSEKITTEIKGEIEKNRKKNKKHKKHAAKFEDLEGNEKLFQSNIDAVVKERSPQILAHARIPTENINKDHIKDENEPREELKEDVLEMPTIVEKSSPTTKTETLESTEKAQNEESDTKILDKVTVTKLLSDVSVKDEIIKSNETEVDMSTKPDKKPEVKLEMPLQSMDTTAQITQQTENLNVSTHEFAEKSKEKTIDPTKEFKEATGKNIDTKEPCEKQDETKQEKPELFFNFPSCVNIQIDVAKAEESEISPPCDAMPDFIEYPRSTSELHLDDNNNTVIQEITALEEVKLGISIGTPNSPLVQGSGETPIKSPEFAAFGIQVIELETKSDMSQEQDKTDLKSKVMQVNQDMEELRLSIEKSLAELTAMEKSEQDVEKQYEEKLQTRTEESTDSSIDKKIPDAEDLSQPTNIMDKPETVVQSENKDIDIKSNIEEEKVPQKIPVVEQTALPICPTKIMDKLKTVAESENKDVAVKSNTEEENVSRTENFPVTEQTILPTCLERTPDSEKLLQTTNIMDERKTVTESEIKDNVKNKTEEEKLSLTENLPVTEQTMSCLAKMPDSEKLLQITNITDEPKTATESENKEAEIKNKIEQEKVLQSEFFPDTERTAPPIYPARREHKGKGKKKGKHATVQNVTTTTSNPNVTVSKESTSTDENKKTEQKAESTQKEGKQQSNTFNKDQDNIESNDERIPVETLPSFEPIDNFEDALTSSVDDVNKTFEMIANETNDQTKSPQANSENATTPEDTEKRDKDQEVSSVPQPKNLLGQPDFPVPSSRKDHKKERNKTYNTKQAKVKIKDSEEIETDQDKKQSRESQTDHKRKMSIENAVNESISRMTNDNVEYVYKYSFRKVFLPSSCHVCKKDLKQARVPCGYCNLVFYCNQRHKDDDWPQHQALCFAISTIVHLKDQKFIYADAKNITGHNYRLLRVQMIVSCEKILKRKLVPCEQEMLLYPRMCADTSCREWRQSKLMDCEACGQISFCADHPEHLPKTHQRWCKSYTLYQKLVCYQQTKGRLEPKLPTRVLADKCQIPGKMNEVLAAIYEEKIDMTDMQYATLTQLATAPLTTVYCHQIFNNANGINKKSSFTIHVVGAELQFEADVLNKWELFFLHLRPDVKQLMIALIAPDLNPSNLPLELLGRIKLCDNCRQSKRRVAFGFKDKKTYSEYSSSEDYTAPDIVCAFNPSIQRSSIYNGKDPWPSTVDCILKLKVPFLITSYTMEELNRDLVRIKECAKVGFRVVSEPKLNSFASVRPDRNFISDDELPLLFKNYCFAVICGD